MMFQQHSYFQPPIQCRPGGPLRGRCYPEDTVVIWQPTGFTLQGPPPTTGITTFADIEEFVTRSKHAPGIAAQNACRDAAERWLQQNRPDAEVIGVRTGPGGYFALLVERPANTPQLPQQIAGCVIAERNPASTVGGAPMTVGRCGGAECSGLSTYDDNVTAKQIARELGVPYEENDGGYVVFYPEDRDRVVEVFNSRGIRWSQPRCRQHCPPSLSQPRSVGGYPQGTNPCDGPCWGFGVKNPEYAAAYATQWGANYAFNDEGLMVFSDVNEYLSIRDGLEAEGMITVIPKCGVPCPKKHGFKSTTVAGPQTCDMPDELARHYQAARGRLESVLAVRGVPAEVRNYVGESCPAQPIGFLVDVLPRQSIGNLPTVIDGYSVKYRRVI